MSLFKIEGPLLQRLDEKRECYLFVNYYVDDYTTPSPL